MRRSIANGNNNKGSGATSAAAAAAAAADNNDGPPLAVDGQDMNNIGLNLGVGVQDLKRIHDKRMRKGECPSCGVKCYKVTGNLLGRKKFMPLTIAGHVKDGICLTCHPAAQHAPTNYPKPPAMASNTNTNNEDNHSPENFNVPQFINDDNDTVVSGITMDHRLWSFPCEETLPDTRWHGTASPRSGKEPPTLRPEASYSSHNDVDDRPMLPRRRASGRVHNHQAAALMRKEAEEKADMRAGTTGSLRMQVDPVEHGIALQETEVPIVENEEEDDVAQEEKLEEGEEEMRRSMKYKYPPPPPIANAYHDLKSQEIFFDSSKQRSVDYPKEYKIEGGIIEAISPRGVIKGRISKNHREITVNQKTGGVEDVMETRSPRSLKVKSRSNNHCEIIVNPDPSIGADAPPPPARPSIEAPALSSRPTSLHRLEQEAAPRVPTRQLSSDDAEEPPYREHRVQLSAGPDAVSLPPRPGRLGDRDLAKLSLTDNDVDDVEPQVREYEQTQRQGYKIRHQSGGTYGSETPRLPVRTTSERNAIPNDDMSIPSLLHLLEGSSDSSSRVMALESLKGALTDVESKRVFCLSRGISNLNSAMWIDMSDSNVQQACSELLVALVAKANENEPDFLTGA